LQLSLHVGAHGVAAEIAAGGASGKGITELHFADRAINLAQLSSINWKSFKSLKVRVRVWASWVPRESLEPDHDCNNSRSRVPTCGTIGIEYRRM